MGRNENIAMLHDTKKILDDHGYTKDGRWMELKLSPEEMTQVKVFLPDEVSDLAWEEIPKCTRPEGHCRFNCENMDSYALARKRLSEGAEDVLVLNLANPVHPGGGVYRGAQAQEEDLCRKSSLLRSLESKAAHRYYRHNRTMNTYLGSDGIIITPKVEVIKDTDGTLLDETAIVSVMTCAAPMITFGLEGHSQREYEDMVYDRIVGMLTCAAYCGYRNLVLGAFGCGAFSNDARIVSDLFAKAIKEFGYNGMGIDDLFDRIDFAVYDRSDAQYNFRHFSRNFSASVTESKFGRQVLGGILGFVVADALGVPVEFEDRETLRADPVIDMRGYGSYDVPAGSWSDDSSMTLCALESLTNGLDYEDMMGRFLRWADEAYMTPHGEVFDMGRTTREALMRYAVGNPALECGATSEYENGNGSLMRILPLALYLYQLRCTTAICWREMIPLVHNVSKLTHAHPISLISCGIYCCIAEQILSGRDLADAIGEGIDHMKEIYAVMPEYAPWLSKFKRVDKDVLLSLGEEDIQSSGYVLHTLEAALWCLLTTDSYRDCVLKAVNLGSDTDTVAAVAGGLAGIYYGVEAVPEEWLETIPRLEQIRSMCWDFSHAYPPAT